MKKMINKEQNELFLLEWWGHEDTAKVMTAIENDNTDSMPLSEFLNHCTAMGGNWGGMLLTGIHELYPEVWKAIPADLGVDSFNCICAVLELCGIAIKEEEK